jgi:hypothetical protein
MRETKAWFGVMLLVVSSCIFANNANATDSTTKNNLLSKSVKIDAAAHKAALVISKGKKLESYENMTHLTDVQLKELLSLVGFKGRDLVVAWAVAKKESNGRPLAFNGNHKTGDSSYGMFQINMIDDLGPDRRDKFDLNHNADLFNPVKNAEIAHYMSRGGEDWSSWKGITPRTKEWIAKFPH